MASEANGIYHVLKKKKTEGESEEIKPWRNKQKVLIFSSRGTNERNRHLMKDLRKLLPHHKKDVKMDMKDELNVINEITEMKSCNNCIFFEVRKNSDCYIWFSRTPNGPSVKFYATNIHTMDELKMTGNCMLGSRPILVFDKNFDTAPHWKLLKELFSQMFGTPEGHPRSKPFIDHALGLYIQDNTIWFRNYQISEKPDKKKEFELVEIGPRFVLVPIRIFAGSFGGPTLWQSAEFVPPTVAHREMKQKKSNRYSNRIEATKKRKLKKESIQFSDDELDHVFDE